MKKETITSCMFTGGMILIGGLLGGSPGAIAAFAVSMIAISFIMFITL